MGRFVKCSSPRCDRLFPFLSGKKYCSSKCRNYADRARSVAMGLKYLSTLPSPEPTYNPAFEDTVPWNLIRPDLVIMQQPPVNAAGYRLGIGREHSALENPSRIRWFPPLSFQSTGLFSLEPFQSLSVPFPGIYIVAYFNEKTILCCQPERLVRIEIPNATVPWYRGDLSLSIKRSDVPKLAGLDLDSGE